MPPALRRSPDGPTLHDVVGDAAFLAGAPRRFLMEIALTPVGHGVADHSRALRDPVGRFRNTTAYIYLVAFGTPAEREAVIGMVNRAHRPVHSAPGAEVSYSAFDPDLQLWVAGCMFYGGRDMWQRMFGTINDEAADRLYREFQTYGTSLQVPPEAWPADRAAFDAYVQRSLHGITIDERVREYGAALLDPAGHPVPVRPVLHLMRFVTIGLLPEELRRAYGFPWGASAQRRFDQLMKVAAALYRATPRRAREMPRSVLLRSSRRMVAAPD
ncbi:oxygenase MpaB family protein [Rhodococcus sp. IEGM 1408]|uniref:oxygenase MpaB family protein n=1 Tax=Rhodococcus sp. IEGM 1408 TaxID=3082220 RepID=UPI002954584B|nr:oxygenase MpaB family protein [Rhodococcus sp. IEGM 1408]MDV8002376.1 oxygenase MpaB family protein [Rhodococcus sp. IEGM 1408]